MEGFFPISVWYGVGKARAPMFAHPTEESYKIAQRDIENIKKLGFNAVRYWIDWATAEPEPGVWNLDFVNRLMDLAGENGLKVIMQLYLDSAPNWLSSSYPNSRYQAQSGDVIDSQASPGFCYDHPGVREEAERFMCRIAKQLKDHPAFYGWDVWSEPHTIEWSYIDWFPESAWFCYCHHSQERFRRWLKKRYGNIDSLNKAWYRTYGGWSEVIPPKYITLSTWRDLVDWQLFNMEKIAENLKWRAQTIKKIDPDHVVSSHASLTSLFNTPMSECGSPDDWELAKHIDIWGTSMYPKIVKGINVQLDPARCGVALDATRSSSNSHGKDFWIGELQSGSGTAGIHFGEPVTPQDVQMWAWSAIAKGAKGLNFYAWYPMSCGYEISGYGLVNLDGSMTERARVAGNVAKIIDQNMHLFSEARPPQAEVAIVPNILSYIMLTCSRERNADILSFSLTGIYRALFEENIPVDFVHINDFTKGNMKKYKLIFMPFSIMMTSEIAEGVKEFVRQGGKLVAEVRPGWSDEKGQCSEVIPGLGLHEVFGCRERWIRERQKPKLQVESVQDAIPSLSRKTEISGAAYEEALEPLKDTAKILARFEDGSPAMIVNSYGEGKAILVGSLISGAYEKVRDEENGKFLKGLFEWAGVKSLVDIDGGEAEGQIMEGEGYNLLFGFNHGNKKVDIIFRLRVPKREYKILDLLSQAGVNWSYENGLRIRRELEPQEVCVLKIE